MSPSSSLLYISSNINIVINLRISYKMLLNIFYTVQSVIYLIFPFNFAWVFNLGNSFLQFKVPLRSLLYLVWEKGKLIWKQIKKKLRFNCAELRALDHICLYMGNSLLCLCTIYQYYEPLYCNCIVLKQDASQQSCILIPHIYTQ